MKRPSIVVIGGGTGIFALLKGLKKRRCDITAIVTMADDGGSTGKLRDEYGVLPPGDIRQALVALSRSSTIWRDLFTFRFSGGGLAGHSFGNLFLSALEQMTGDFPAAIERASEILNAKGRVVPVTLTDTRLCAELEDGAQVRGEHRIENEAKPRRIKRVWLEPVPVANPAALAALQTADIIVVGPGSLFSSIIPNLIVPGVAEAIQAARAKKIFVCNIMTQPNETAGFTLADFLLALDSVLKPGTFDAVVYNSTRPAKQRLAQYAEKQSEVVEKGALPAGGPSVIELGLITSRSYIRHDPKKIANAILKLL